MAGWLGYNSKCTEGYTLIRSFPRVINFKFSLQPDHKCHTTSMKTLAFYSFILRWKMIIAPILTTSLIHYFLKGWGNILFEFRSVRVKIRDYDAGISMRKASPQKTQASTADAATNSLTNQDRLSCSATGLPDWEQTCEWAGDGVGRGKGVEGGGEAVRSGQHWSELSGSVEAGPMWLFCSDFLSCSESANIWHVYSFHVKQCPWVFFQECIKIWTKLREIHPIPPLSARLQTK